MITYSRNLMKLDEIKRIDDAARGRHSLKNKPVICPLCRADVPKGGVANWL